MPAPGQQPRALVKLIRFPGVGVRGRLRAYIRLHTACYRELFSVQKLQFRSTTGPHRSQILSAPAGTTASTSRRNIFTTTSVPAAPYLAGPNGDAVVADHVMTSKGDTL
jgi:hypothetical protein